MKTIGVIGTGNMGGALIKGFLSAQQYQVLVYDVRQEAAEKFCKLGAQTAQSVEELAGKADYLILTVKPNVYPAVLAQAAQAGYSGTIVTVAPGFSVQKASQAVPGCRVVRTMPNTPALVGEGVVLIACEPGQEEALRDVEELMGTVGRTYLISEKLMDGGVALSGSSPAFVYAMIDALANGAVAAGFAKKTAVEIAAQTVLGSAKMVLETKEHPMVLKDNVCSPGGTTIAAMNALEAAGFQTAVLRGMEACEKKAKELS